jgi:hypothetical protein
MSVPGNINPATPPSSFDDNPEFYEESRLKTLRRRVMEEPILPLGCALTCWALYEATKSMKAGDHYRTNRMFRRRIYAQGFTIVAMVAGSIYWESDRKRRKEYEGLVGEKKKKEKYELWIKELEAREEEEQELRQVRRKLQAEDAAERQRRMGESGKRQVEAEVKESMGQPKGGLGVVKSVLEESERRRGRVLDAAMEAWRGSER